MARIALVTGGSRGIGRAICLQLAAEGCTVAVNYRGNAEAAAATVAAIRAAGGDAEAFAFAVEDRVATTAAIKRIAQDLGPIAVLVNNAGIARDGLLVRMTDAAWDEVLATDLGGTFACTRAVLATWAGRWDPAVPRRIINITSVSGVGGRAGMTNYCAAKAGMIGFTKALARELAGKGVTVNAVAPGVIDTEALAHLDLARFLPEIPLGRTGRTEEVADAVAFLASARASYITGHVLHVDGGMVM